MTVIFAAGGTAGHVYMANGIAKHLQQDRILITDERGVKYIEDNIFSHIHVLPIRSAKITNIMNIFSAYRRCTKIFRQNPGATYFGCGAYTSLIAGLAASQCGNEIHLYQGDQVPGTANKILQYFAKTCWVSSENINLRNKRVVGCIGRFKPEPLRNDGTFRILVVGSSIGTELVSETLPKALNALPESLRSKIEVYQQNRNPDECHAKYHGLKHVHVAEFLDVPALLPATHLVIGRAGWSLLSDLVSARRAAIIMPWMQSKDHHQEHNALWIDPKREWTMDEHDADALSERIRILAEHTLEENKDFVLSGPIADRMHELSEFKCNAGEAIAHGLENIY